MLPLDRPVIDLAGNGRVALSSAGSGDVSLWTPGRGWVDLTGPTAVGLAVSSTGSEVLGGDLNGGFLWERGFGWAPIAGPGQRVPRLLSGDGLRVVARTEFGTNGTPYIWDRVTDSISELELTALAEAATVGAVDETGSRVVGDTIIGGAVRATIWDADGDATLLEALGSGLQSTARGVSTDGQWVVGSRFVGDVWIPFRWSESGGIQDLPRTAPLGPDVVHFADFVSDSGDFVIGTRIGFLDPPETAVQSFVSSPASTGLTFRAFILSTEDIDVGEGAFVLDMTADARRFLVTSGLGTFWLDLDALISLDYCGPGVPNSTGQRGSMLVLGSNEAAQRSLYLRATNLPPGQTVLPLCSRTQGFFPMVGGSLGTLCVGGVIGRFDLGTSDSSGVYQVQADGRLLPEGGMLVPVLAGQSWNFQVWHRDVGGVSNLTNGAFVSFI